MYLHIKSIPEIARLSKSDRKIAVKKIFKELGLGWRYALLTCLSIVVGILSAGSAAQFGFNGDVVGAIAYVTWIGGWVAGHLMVVNLIVAPKIKDLSL